MLFTSAASLSQKQSKPDKTINPADPTDAHARRSPSRSNLLQSRHPPFHLFWLSSTPLRLLLSY